MSGFRRPEQPREQMVLWTQRLDDAIPVSHPVRQFEYLLNSDAFAETFSEWESQYVLLEGKPPYHPSDLSALYLYGMMHKIRSSRQLEGACYNRIDVIWLMQGQHPDHSTIAGFVKAHGKRLRRLFLDVLQVALKAGLVKLEHVAVDGTKIEADASKGSVRKEDSIAAELGRLEERIATLESEWASNEAREARLFGPEVPWTPKGGGSDRRQLAAMKRQQERLQQALSAIARRRDENPGGRTPAGVASVTDPDSRWMPDKEGKSKPNYNAQVVVDTACGVVVASDVTDAAEDSGQLTPMVDQVESQSGRLPQEASADSQYNTGPALAEMETRGVVVYLPDAGTRSHEQNVTSPAEEALKKVHSGMPLQEVDFSALPKNNQGFISRLAFVYDPQEDAYRCPAGQKLPFLRGSEDRKKWGIAYRAQYGGCSACSACPHASFCCRNPAKGRMVTRDQYEDHRERLRARMSTAVGQARYRLRGPTVEGRFGHIKRVLGLRRFLLRGLGAVQTEWAVACTAVNVGILLRHWEEVRAIL